MSTTLLDVSAGSLIGISNGFRVAMTSGGLIGLSIRVTTPSGGIEALRPFDVPVLMIAGSNFADGPTSAPEIKTDVMVSGANNIKLVVDTAGEAVAHTEAKIIASGSVLYGYLEFPTALSQAVGVEIEALEIDQSTIETLDVTAANIASNALTVVGPSWVETSDGVALYLSDGYTAPADNAQFTANAGGLDAADVGAPSGTRTTAAISTSQAIPTMQAVNLGFASRSADRLAAGAIQLWDSYPITLTEAQYDALTEYEPRLYNIIDTGDRYYEALCIYRAPWKYAATDWHVTKSGDDGTADGSLSLPYLTIEAAFNDAVTAGGGKRIWVHAGTYAEDSGAGYFQPSGNNPASLIEIRARPDQDVVLTNVSGAYVIRPITTNSNLTIRGFRIEAVSAVSALFLTSGSDVTLTNWSFVECDFNDTQNTTTSIHLGGTTTASANVSIHRCQFRGSGRMSTNLQNVNGLNVVGCRWYLTKADTTIAIRLNASLAGTINVNNNYISLPNATTTSQGIYNDVAISTTGVTLNIKRNRLNVARSGMYITGGNTGNHITLNLDDNHVVAGQSGIRVEGGVSAGSADRNYVDSAGSIAFGYPTDSANTELIDGVTLNDNEVYSTVAVGHGFLIGQNSQNVTASGNYVDSSGGGYFGLILKGTNNTVTNSTFYGGDQNSIYIKGADGCVVENCVAYQNTDTTLSSGAIGFAAGINAEPLVDNTIRNCIVYMAIGELYDFVGADLSTGNVIGPNTYILSGTATWGNMFGAAVNSLADVQASWAANYGVTTNDSTSYDQ